MERKSISSIVGSPASVNESLHVRPEGSVPQKERGEKHDGKANKRRHVQQS